MMVMTNVGLNKFRDMIRGTDTTIPKYIALGDDDTAEQQTDSSLGNETYREEGSLTIPQDKLLIIGTELSPGEANGTYKEIGNFDASSGGKMPMRQTFAPVTKTSDYTWRVEVAYEFTGG